MTPFKHILVPTDFGEAAARALDFAIELASKFEAKLTLLHASWLPPLAYAAYAEGLYWPTDEMARGAQKELDAVLSKTKERYPGAEGAIVTGEPWQMILEVAKDRSADLIVMGTHGRRGLSRVFLGSVAERIVRLSPIPVLTISAAGEQQAKEKAFAQASRTIKVAPIL
jgi:nucleotide-binding universal stress UspA family protein